MKAVLCKSLDGPDGLTVEELPSPTPGPGEVKIKVEAASLNFFDTLITRGKYQNRPPLPFSPGAEIVGTVLKAGEGVSSFRQGQRVLGYIRVGGCAQELVAKVETLTPLPENIASEVACVLPITYGTAIHALEDRGQIKPGETLLVLGATGGAGLAAVELGKKFGARVIATGTSDEKLQLCAEHGAAHLLNLTRADLREELRALTGGEGVDVVYDCIGGPYAEPCVRSMAWNGRYLVIGFAQGEIPQIPLNLLLLKGCALVGVFLARHCEKDPARFADQMQRLISWCASGELKPHIDHTYPLEETADALRAFEARKIKGKVVIKP